MKRSNKWRAESNTPSARTQKHDRSQISPIVSTLFFTPIVPARAVFGLINYTDRYSWPYPII